MKTIAVELRGAASRRLTVPWERLFWLTTAAIVVYLVAVPLVMLVFSSVRSTEARLPFEATEFTLANYLRVFTSNLTYRLLWNSALYAVGSVAIGLLVTVALSWILERTDVPLRSFWLVMVLAPMAFPGIVIGMAWILLANPTNGLLNGILRTVLGNPDQGPIDIYSLPGMIFVTALRLVPSMYVMLSGTFSRLDPTLEEAGYVAGARLWTTVRRITLPLLRPGILAAAIYYLVVTLEVFEIPALLGLPRRIFVLSTLIYNAVHPAGSGLPNYGLASAYAMIFLVIAAGFIYIYARLTRHSYEFAVVSGKGYKPQLIRLGRWRYAALGGLCVYCLLSSILPFLILLWASLLPSFVLPSLEALAQVGLRNFSRAASIPGLIDSVRNSLVISVLTAGACMTLSSLVSWLAVRGSGRVGAIPDRLTFVLLGVPSVVLGLALIFVYVWIPLPVYATIWIIVVGLTTRFLTYGTRTMGAALLQIHRELEEAAHVSGAPWGRTMGRIVLPLVRPSFLRSLLWVFVHSFTDTTMALMLFAVGNATLAVRMWFLWTEEADFTGAATLAVLLLIPSTILTLAVARWTKPAGAA